MVNRLIINYSISPAISTMLFRIYTYYVYFSVYTIFVLGTMIINLHAQMYIETTKIQQINNNKLLILQAHNSNNICFYKMII